MLTQFQEFLHFFISNIGWIPFTFSMIVAFYHIHWRKRHSWPSSTCIFKVTGVKFSAACNFVHWFPPRHLLAFHSNFNWLLLATTQSAESQMVNLDLFSWSQGSKKDTSWILLLTWELPMSLFTNPGLYFYNVFLIFECWNLF